MRAKIVLLGVLGSAIALLPACGVPSTDPSVLETGVTEPAYEAESAPPATDVGSATERVTIAEIAAAAEPFSTFKLALDRADLTTTLGTEGPFTVFVPTDEAFAQLPEGTLQSLLQPENRDVLTQLLTYHVVPRRLSEADLAKPGKLSTAAGMSLELQRGQADEIRINDATLAAPAIAASNGVIYPIDEVLLPPGLQP